jgi:PAS domain S-box-containing protein
LLVEDSEDDAVLITGLLGKGGYDPHALRVQNAAAMRAALVNHTWDVIICDYRLPQFNAPVALRVLQETGEDIPFIVISGAVGEEAAVEMMRTGAHDYLLKDNLTRLHPAVAREIREAHIRRARREAEAALRESEQRLALAIDATELGTFDYDPKTGQMRWSAFAKRHFGLHPDAPISYQTFLRGLHPDDRERVVALIQSAFRAETGGHFATEHRTIGIDDGVERWLSAWGRVVFGSDGRALRFVGVSLDITERKRAERAVRDALEKAEEGRRILQAMMEHIPLGLTIADGPDLKVRVVSRFWHDLVGTSRSHTEEEPSTNPHGDGWCMYHADGVTPATKEELPLVRATSNGEIVQGEEWILVAADGRRIPILCTAAPIRDANGRVQGGVSGWQDISERKRMETALQESAQREAEANRVKDEVLANLSHELRTPLNVILGRSRMVLGRPAAPTRTEVERINHAVGIIERNATAQLRIVEDLLDVQRIVAGKFRTDLAPCNLKQMGQTVIDSIMPSAKAKRLHLQATMEPVILTCDGPRIQQVMWNLLSNAIKFTPEDGRLGFQLFRDAEEVIIRIADTGEGMPADFLPHVFERFRQLDMTTTRRHNGLGLGLHISKHVVELHGGIIRAESPGPGLGSTFTVRLPIIQQTPQQPAAQQTLPQEAAQQT